MCMAEHHYHNNYAAEFGQDGMGKMLLGEVVIAGEGRGDYSQRFHFYKDIFLGQWYLEQFLRTSMVLKSLYIQTKKSLVLESHPTKLSPFWPRVHLPT